MQNPNINYQQNGQQYLLKMFINNIEVPMSNISKCSIREWVIGTPVTLEATIQDQGTFIELSPLFDECPVSVEFSKPGDLIPQKIEFQMNVYETERSPADNGNLYIIHFIAFQKTTDYFYPIHARVFKNMNSSEVLKMLCDESDIKFSGDVQSNDVQNWIQGNVNNHLFIKHLMKRSYVKEEDLPIFYFDRFNTGNYSTLKTKCSIKPKFVGINSDYAFMDNGNSDFSKLFLDSSTKSKPLYYYTSFNTKNIASILNKRTAYGIDYTYFDFKDFFEYKMFFKFSPLTNYVNQNSKNAFKYSNGMQYNSQHKNVHSNYILAMAQNEFIRDSFYNNYLQIYVNPESELKLGDIVNMIIFDNVSKIINGVPSIDKANSGNYIVGGIMHDFKNEGLYNMVVTLFRNGINKPERDDIVLDLIEGDF